LASRSNEEEEREVSTSACVAEIRELCVQFQRAIAALAANDIAELETATAAQDSLVDKLKNWFRGQPSDQQPSVKVSPSDFRELANLTQVYSYLLQKALRTSRLRAALCETYKQNFPSESEPAPATGWSCEV
jgi:predicted translin family RNA/ssDNA-binding protein